MKQILGLVLATTILMITGCETTREITFNEDNNGSIQTTMDMSSLIGMAKMSGQGKEMDKLGDRAIDTSIMMDKIADSLKDISAEDRALVRKGTLNLKMNMADEKFIIKLQFPFSDPAEIAKVDQLSTKMIQQALKKQLGDNKDVAASMPGQDDLPESSMEDYFITTYSKGIIQKKLNKEKYANVDNDEGMKALKQVASMGVGSNTIIINLPRPAKKADGKNLKLSDDKKKVTITNSPEDFFDDAPSMEFNIEY